MSTDFGDPRLTFRPGPRADSIRSLEPYDGALGVGGAGDRDGVLYIPETAQPGAPPILFFHGAGGTGRRELRAVVAAADRYGAVVIAPDSRGPTWDIIFNRAFGPDPEFIDTTLRSVATRFDVDLSRLAIGGISDGASYALSLGLTNGDIFPWVIAFSPGFAAPGEFEGKPCVFVSHGTQDPVLPIDMCSRRLVSLMRSVDFDVTYEEFDGGHTVPPPIADQAFAWWLGIAD
jgi:phospholipase/carboxylesterase